ncbi:hypothetical protein EDD68_11351 [Melghiribacillus thermohalophilus]|uniref:Uncharacterized protein n=1 Tax=Melghiribacillus thermohalophilus TaxID=1324956 RepID=A0A4R3MXI2_9BACI|nr:hypothetical protein [Melghiribacillus thermohalophilus]TCT20487.1 hypothetical protein EDD68_11351 [Melghiribacillus thermohalophilus]
MNIDIADRFRTFSWTILSILLKTNGKTIGSDQVIGRILPADFQKSGDELINHIKDVHPDDVRSPGMAG